MTEPWFFDVFPNHPAPYPGECFSGYLLRLAQANGFVSFWDLVSDLFPFYQQTNQISLLRWEYPVDDWGRIPLRTQLSTTDLQRLTVLPWVGKFRSPPVATRANHLSPGHFLQGIVHPHLRVCPLCLQAQPYLRLMWRLTPVQVCLEHGCLLQAQCHGCGTPLTVLGPAHRHLHCAVCDMDLRTLPAITAPADILAVQQRQQADLRFLLDPDITLIHDPTCDPRKAIGLKFRFLRRQTGLSVADMGRQIGVSEGIISALELGQHTALPFYLTYLNALPYSWADLPALEIPHEFLQSINEPSFMHLRLCPTPECVNHDPPPTVGVRLLKDLPDCRKVRFRCMACGRSFTRTYEGEQVVLPRRPLLGPGEPPTVAKSKEEVARLVEMGLQGMGNVQIARQLGWGHKTVAMYWISLDVEDQVHQAQAQRRAQEKQDRHASRRDCVETILRSMLNEDEEITLHRVDLALGHTNDYLHNYRDLVERVREVAQPHNARVRQRKHEELSMRIAQAIEEARQSDEAMTVRGVAERVGLSYSKLRESHPELHATVRQAVKEHRALARADRTQVYCAHINEAAARLATKGSRLTHQAILEEAGVDKNKVRFDSVVQELLRQWVGNFAPRD
jgi:transcriptional regulator with XRE-family HTH domain